MARTSEALVKGVLLRDYNSSTAPSLSPFIDTASAVVDDIVACASGRGLTVSSTKLELIERWIAAHAYKQSDQAMASKSTDGASASYQGQTGMFLEGTKYGQMALMLDTTGCLRAIANGSSARGIWLGRKAPQQTDWNNNNLR